MATKKAITTERAEDIVATVAEVEESKFNLRPLKAKDLFPVCGILKKIGYKEIKRAFDVEVVSDAAKKGDLNAVGLGVVLDIAGAVICNLEAAENEIYSFCASVSGLTVQEVQNLDLGDFGELIQGIVKAPGFRDFFARALSFMK